MQCDTFFAFRAGDYKKFNANETNKNFDTFLHMRLGKARANLRRFAEKIASPMPKGLEIGKDLDKTVDFLHIRVHVDNLSLDMRFPTMWYVRSAKAPTSLRIRAV